MAIGESPLLLGIFVASLGGLLSFLSPCVLPLVPGYLGFLTGTVVSGDTTPARRHLLAHSLSFVVGFAVVFTVAGIALGQFILQLQYGLDYVRWFGGVAVIILGVHTIGLVRIPVLDRQAKIAADDRLPRGKLTSSFLLGIFFAAGWSPCVGVILSGIFVVAASEGARAGVLFFSYAIGLGIPFVLTALAFGAITPLLRQMNKRLGVVSAVSGAFLVVVGVLLLTDSFTRLAAYAPVFEPTFLS